MVNCDDDRSEDSVMAQVKPYNPRVVEFLGFIKAAEMELQEAAFKYSEGERDTARNCVQRACLELEWADDILDKPRNESPNGPLRASEKR